MGRLLNRTGGTRRASSSSSRSRCNCSQARPAQHSQAASRAAGPSSSATPSRSSAPARNTPATSSQPATTGTPAPATRSSQASQARSATGAANSNSAPSTNTTPRPGATPSGQDGSRLSPEAQGAGQSAASGNSSGNQVTNLISGLANSLGFGGGGNSTAANGNSQADPAKGQATPAQKPEKPEKPGFLQRLTQGGQVQLSDDERRQIQQASGVLDRLAGADGIWNRGDLNNNVSQLERSGDLSSAVRSEIGRRVAQEKSERGLIGRALVNAHMNRNYGNYYNQGMNQARGIARGQLGEGLDQGGVKPTAGHDAERAARLGPDAARNAGRPISRAEMEQFQSAMEMLQQRSKSQGLPEVKFPNGIPAGFLRDVGQGRSPLGTILDAGGQIDLFGGK